MRNSKNHCDNDQVIDITTRSEYINSQEREELELLKQESEKLTLHKPSELAWGQIKENLPKPIEEKGNWSILVGLAASVTLCIGLFMYSFHQSGSSDPFSKYANEAERISSSMTNQIDSTHINENLLWKLAVLDEKINNTSQVTLQTKLLIERNEILAMLAQTSLDNEQLI